MVTNPNSQPDRLRVAPGTVLYIATDEQFEDYFDRLDMVKG